MADAVTASNGIRKAARMTTAINHRIFAACLAAVACLAGTSVAQAQNVAQFYAGKQIKIIVGGTEGGGYAPYARMLANHMGQYVPGNPQVIVQFMPGAGGLVATNYVYNVAPRDGTVIGAVQRNVARLALIGDKGAKYEPTKINWVGSLHNDVSVCVAWHTADVKTIQDAMQRELVVGGTGLNDTEQFPQLLNKVLGTKFKVISGYKGSSAISLAMERGEVSGRCGWSWDSIKSQQADWLTEKKVNVLLQLSMKKLPELGDVPMATELAKSKADREILEFVFGQQTMGKPFMLGPGVPQDRVRALREAFMKAAADPAALAEMTKTRLGVSPVSGEELQQLVEQMYATPPDVIARASEAVTSE
jgi:tripartite-type tricarboxylate transporter receptor subunit TctC